MDYKDYEAGQSASNFYFKAKEDLIDKLLSLNIKKKNVKILSIGVGIGKELEILNKFGEVYIIDINKKILEIIPKKLCFEKKLCDACKIDYPENFFDIVIAFDVLEHIPNDKLAVSEIYRVLKKGSNFLFSVPAFQFLFSAHDKALEHKRRYSKIFLRNLLKKFSEIKLDYWNFILFLPFAFLRLVKAHSKPKISKVDLPALVNLFPFILLKIENLLIKLNFKFPFGLSIIGNAKK